MMDDRMWEVRMVWPRLDCQSPGKKIMHPRHSLDGNCHELWITKSTTVLTVSTHSIIFSLTRHVDWRMERALEFPVQTGLGESPRRVDFPGPVDDVAVKVGDLRDGVVGSRPVRAECRVDDGQGGPVGVQGGAELAVAGGPLVFGAGLDRS